MDSKQAVQLLNDRIAESAKLRSGTWGDAPFEEWNRRTDRTLRRIFGDDHDFVKEFKEVRFSGTYLGSTEAESFASDMASAKAILRAAVYELEELTTTASFADAAGIDPELWEHVQQLVEAEDWAKVASQASIFVESHIRQWAGRPAGEVGVILMTAVFKTGGEFPLGRTDGERDGWLALARGLSGAIRNVDTHHIQVRPDAKRYALGVLGAASLLLTQLRFEHGNRFRQIGEKP